MNEELHITQIIISAITAACAVVLPVLFHLLGLGSIFLPMFIPLSIGAYFLTPVYALLTGTIAPITSTILTGMPPLYPPVAIIMMIELALFCFIISLLKQKFYLNSYFIIIIAIIFDRIILYVLYSIILPFFKISFAMFSLYDLFKSFSGIILLIIITPIAVNGINVIIQKNTGR
ncbi:MAG: hypothetical protein AB1444_08205 [Spirochaetota bacterium]